MARHPRQVRCRLAWHRVKGEQNGSPRAEDPLPSLSKAICCLSCLTLTGLAFDFGYFLGSGKTDAVFVLPQHVTDRDDLKPQLKRLLSHFHIPGDVQKLSDSAKEMELFSLVHNELTINMQGWRKVLVLATKFLICLFEMGSQVARAGLKVAV